MNPRRRVLLILVLPVMLAACGRPDALVRRHREASHLLGVDQRFARLAQKLGARKVFAHFLAHHAVFYPEEHSPLVGRRAILGALPGRRGPRLDWTPGKAWVSRDDTVGVTSGVFAVSRRTRSGVSARYGDYLALWVRRDGHWRVRDIMQNLRSRL